MIAMKIKGGMAKSLQKIINNAVNENSPTESVSKNQANDNMQEDLHSNELVQSNSNNFDDIRAPQADNHALKLNQENNSKCRSPSINQRKFINNKQFSVSCYTLFIMEKIVYFLCKPLCSFDN